ncbi:hypothetical protein ANCDUO_10164 [Ancylostoma duodenale]|uniref:Uncharacterized protein n=1 Tax=Ancylostoma duodenale TaxID=51022 RepID=A0A0C2CRZ6_9BILA|nr:hypothetical protein ANCDUO_10164 [Ancylostoma duodenale]
MEIDAGESEGEYGDFDDAARDRPGRGPWSAAGRGRGAPGSGMRGMPFGTPRGHRAMPPTPRGRGAYPVTPRGGPPQHPGRAGFMTPQPSGPSPSNRGSFFSPPVGHEVVHRREVHHHIVLVACIDGHSGLVGEIDAPCHYYGKPPFRGSVLFLIAGM